MRNLIVRVMTPVPIMLLTAFSALAGEQVVTSGKQDTALEEVPPAVLQAASKARPDLAIEQAEYETRDGREYYDVGGTLEDGSELELDMMLTADGWKVMEIQRDIDMTQVPEPVGYELKQAVPGWAPHRIIESDQGDGVVIYEFFGPGDGDEPRKLEVKYRAGQAELLADEWAH